MIRRRRIAKSDRRAKALDAAIERMAARVQRRIEADLAELVRKARQRRDDAA